MQRKLDAARDVENARRDIDLAQNALESQVAELRALEAALEQLRETHFSASDAVHNAQAELYDANAAVARLEQQLLHLKQNRDRLNQDFEAARIELARVDQTASQSQAEQNQWLQQEEDASLAAEAAAMALEEESTRLPELEQAQREAEAAFERAREQLAQSRNSLQLAQQQGANHVRNCETLKIRLDRLQLELQRLEQTEGAALEELNWQLEEAALALETRQLAVADDESALEDARASLQAITTQRDDLQRAYASVQARVNALASMPAPVDDKALQQWLSQHHLQSVPRLFEALKIDDRWGKAVEAVLGLRMQARPIAAFPDAMPPSAVALLLPASAGLAGADLPLPRLSVHVRASEHAAALQDWLGLAWCIDTPETWQQWREQLPLGGVLVTPEGHVGDRHAMHFHAAQGVVANLVAQRQALETAQAEEVTLAPQWQAIQADHAGARDALTHIEQTLRAHRNGLAELQARHADIARQAARLEEAAAQQLRQQAQWREELEVVSTQLEEEIYAGQEAEQARVQLDADLAPLQETQELARLARHEAESACDLQRSRLRQAERLAQESRFAVQAAQARLLETRRRDEDLQQRREIVAERLETLTLELEGIDEGDFDIGFQEAINLRSERERVLAGVRDALNGFAQQNA